MSATHLLHTLFARKWLFLSILGGAILAAASASMLWPKTYIAETSLVVEVKMTDPVSGNAESPDLLPSTIATQVDIIGSHNVAKKVVERLGLNANPEFKQRFASATHQVGSIDDWIADEILKKVTVNPSRDSHIINVDVGASDPHLAAKLADEFAEAYMQTNLELKVDPARRQSEWFATQMKELRAALEAAQSRLSTAQRQTNVVGTNSQIDIENTRLAELSSQLLAAQAKMYESQNKLKQINQAVQDGRLDELPELASNPLVENLREALARAQGKLAQTAGELGNHHPDYVSAQAEVNSLQSKLNAAIRTAAGSMSQDAAVNARQQNELQNALNKQRDHVLQLKVGNDNLDILRRDVESAQQAYDAGLHRANQIRLESQLDQSNIAILNPAEVPSVAASPKMMLNVAVAAVIGFVLALGCVIAVERFDQRVRSSDEFFGATGIVLLSQIPRIPGRNYHSKEHPSKAAEGLLHFTRQKATP